MLTLAEVLALLGIPPDAITESEAAVMNQAIAAMSAQIRLYTSRWLSLSEWQDTFYGSELVMLGEYPVTEIASVMLGDTLVDPLYYFVDPDSGTMYLRDGNGYITKNFLASYLGFPFTSFPWWGTCAPPSVVVTYTAGYSPLPYDLQTVIANYAAEQLKASRLSGLATGGSGSSSTIRTVTIEGVGAVTYNQESAATRIASAAVGPIIGPNAAILDMYRDISKSVAPQIHRLLSTRLGDVTPVPPPLAGDVNGYTEAGDQSIVLPDSLVGTFQVRYNAPLTAPRTVLLSGLGEANIRVSRTAAATGSFPVNVGSGPLIQLQPGEWAECAWSGLTYVLVAAGALEPPAF